MLSGLWPRVPLVVLGLLLAIQVASPLFMKDGVVTAKTGRTAFAHPDRYSSFALSIADMKRAASGDERCLSDVRFVLDRFARPGHYETLKGRDPAALMGLSIGDRMSDNFVPTGPLEYANRLLLGFPAPWLAWSESSANFANIYRSVLNTWTYPNLEWQDASKNPRPVQILRVDLRSLSVLVTAVSFSGLLIAILIRPRRSPAMLHRFRVRWGVAALGMLVVFLLLPTPPRGAYAQPLHWTSWTSGVPDVQTSMTLADFMQIAEAPDGSKRIAEWAVANSTALEADPDGAPRSVSSWEVMTIGVIQRTPSHSTHVRFGWPWQWLTLGQISHQAPLGQEPTPGAAWSFGPTEAGFPMSISLNRGAWPGTERSASIWPNALGATAGFLIAAWAIPTLTLAMIAARTARRRLLKHRCINCGYDLKGLRPTTN